ncbi:autotransporter outer membrane beta-barrel domain-containing protein [Acuticoccus mangrovi]|uniref:Autotransporter outer membrane beta-barrel domain-containing protein n=1 Tax=Acuticoccus mangrovi TaxID=2796142 RepID=A0A934IKR7_9HYPH|nr:autotransporter outer membrane beta-barrel domain-containing protein [Acuticoccus mangrovi]MBJ3775607.1 autotransporter outer membrane beta-barrel domain-containing protein [Acuticoccus mangrovi]
MNYSGRGRRTARVALLLSTSALVPAAILPAAADDYANSGASAQVILNVDGADAPQGYDFNTGIASGDDGGDISATITGIITDVTQTGTMIGAVTVTSGGGTGAMGIAQGYASTASPGNGGDGGTVAIYSRAGIDPTTATSGIVGTADGGVGGEALYDTTTAGTGGDGGSVLVRLNAASGVSRTVNARIAGGFGVFASALGGDGGDGLKLASNAPDLDDYDFPGGQGGVAGDGGTATVNANAVTVITTEDGAVGISVLASGGDGGSGGNNLVTGEPPSGGAGGDGGTATITTATGSEVNTTGDDAIALDAEANGGIGGSEGTAFGSGSEHDTPGAAGNGGTVTVGNRAVLKTTGTAAHGISAQANSGSGGNAARQVGFFESISDSGGAGGAGGTVTVTNRATGLIDTEGDGAVGILAQSIGGTGGNGGQSSAIAYSVGGNGGTSGPGGSVTVANVGEIDTAGIGAPGILAISVGGGGGLALGTDVSAAAAAATGGDAGGIFVATGGTGGAGGDGGTVVVSNRGTITTQLDHSHGILAYSVGGGGGAGGGAFSGAPLVSVAVGGNGSTGGAGGDVTVNPNLTGRPKDETKVGSIETFGVGANGISAGSVGGGGGDGGAASAFAFGVPIAPNGATLSVAVAIGGKGKGGGDGGTVLVNNANSIITHNDDAIGIYASSIGGGGGSGGQATSTSLSATFVSPPFSLSASVAVGGSADDGGAGGTVTTNNYGDITTYGDQSIAILAHSVGGGGGNGGNAKALASSFSFGDGSQNSIGVAVGGSGGGGGAGGVVTVTNAGALTTSGAKADAILAQSVGGGGGTGGIGAAYAIPGISLYGSKSNAVTVGVGGSGGEASAGDTVTVTNTGAIIVNGNDSRAIVAQSIGGGGGTGGGGQADSNSLGITLGVAVGGSGGGGGAGGIVTVDNQADITTLGHGGTGILVQSIGGGGGTGGSSTANNELPGIAETGEDVTEVVEWFHEAIEQLEKAGEKGEGEDGDGEGGDGEGEGEGEGGNGEGGENGSKGPPEVQINVSVGGKGGDGGDGDVATVTNTGTITTSGDMAQAIFIQSIGGGGGTSTVAAGKQAEFGGEVTVGRSGGGGGDGGLVTVTNSGALVTSGNIAAAMFAQSVGGGGGLAGITRQENAFFLPVGVAVNIGGTGGTGGDGAAVEVDNSGAIDTSGTLSIGILAQSIGGGGGLHYVAAQDEDDDGVSINFPVPLYGNPGTAAETPEADDDDGDGNDDDGEGDDSGGDNQDDYGTIAGAGLSLNFGAKAGASGDGGTVDITNAASIDTGGDEAFGILAQSIGGGGGVSGLHGGISGGNNTLITPTYTQTAGEADAASGSNVAVHLNGGTKITTTGTGAVGVLAQSIGGGGGHRSGGTGAAETNPESAGLSGNANSGDVTIDTDGGPVSITTSGFGAHGIFAQSNAGGGGTYGTYEGVVTVSAPLSDGEVGSLTVGNVDVDYTGSITASGENSVGIYAEAWNNQSAVAAGTIDITVDGDITGGSGASAAGIAIVGGAGDTITIDGGTISAGDGGFAVAARFAEPTTGFNYDPEYALTLINGGTIVGNIDLGGGAANFENNGIFHPGESVVIGNVPDAGVQGISYWNTLFADNVVPDSDPTIVGAGNSIPLLNSSFDNTGTVDPAGPGTIGQSIFVVDGFNQSAEGTLALDVDYGAASIDRIVTTGEATLSGTVRPSIIGVASAPSGDLPTLEFFEATSVDSSALSVVDTIAVDYTLGTVDPGGLTLAATIDVTQDAAASEAASAIAQNLQANYEAGTLGATMSGFVSLLNVPTGSESEYQDALESLSGDVAVGSTHQVAGGANALARNSLHSCPVFVGEAALLEEEKCVYGKAVGRFLSETGDGSTAGVRSRLAGVVIGGQAEVADDTFLGGVVGLGGSWSKSTDGRLRATGETYSVGAVVKHRFAERWEIAASAVYTYTDSDHSRSIGGLAPAGTTAQSDVASHTIGGRARFAYYGNVGDTYLKPMVDLEALYTSVPAYSERGAGAYDLHYSSSDDVSLAVAPALEVGRRINLETGVLRAYARAGAAYWHDRTSEQDARFGGTTSTLAFENRFEGSRLFATGTIGAEIVAKGGLEFRAEYDIEANADAVSHAVSARLGFRF